MGFSPASDQAPDITSEQQVAHDMRSFLTSFLTVFQEFEDMQVYISGESYAGNASILPKYSSTALLIFLFLFFLTMTKL